MKYAFALVVMLFSCAGFCRHCNASFIYDAVRDFSVSSNAGVNGVWSYGQGTGSSFSLLPFSSEKTFGIDGLLSWSGTNPAFNLFYPIIAANATGSSIPVGEIPVFPTDLLFLHPANTGVNEEATVRWTAPTSGIFELTGLFQGLQKQGSAVPTTDVKVLLNGSENLFAGNINSFAQPIAFSLTKRLQAGDILDFAVGDGGNNFFVDGTGFNVQISAVPEPSTMLLAVVGVSILPLYRKQRKSAV